jgi:predicted ester cyclase
MPNTDAQALVRRFIQEVFVDRRADALPGFVTPDFVSHGLPGSGPDVLRGAIERTSKGLSDVSMKIDDIFGEGDRVAVRLTSTATQSGEFMGMPPSGKSYTIEELHLFRVADGKVAEHWHQMDSMGMMKQLGGMPGAKG